MFLCKLKQQLHYEITCVSIFSFLTLSFCDSFILFYGSYMIWESIYFFIFFFYFSLICYVSGIQQCDSVTFMCVCVCVCVHMYVYEGNGFRVALVVKNPPAKAGDLRDMGLIPGSGRSPRRGHGNPLQCSYLENPMDRGAWRATVH